eukprot:jgi/Phyca11/510418/fgenesh2_kg.PHYCAscaffold_60_\
MKRSLLPLQFLLSLLLGLPLLKSLDPLLSQRQCCCDLLGINLRYFFRVWSLFLLVGRAFLPA